jgi:hypothetical protein
MGYIEETGAAQHYRDARISPIYEGTNGIQAADLVGRKLGLEGGAVFRRLLADIEAEAEGPLATLVEACRRVAGGFEAMDPDDRMAGSYPFLTMLSVAVSGWLMRRSLLALDGAEVPPNFAAMKRAAATYYLEQAVPEALGLEAQAVAGASLFYSIPDEALAEA